MPQPRRSRPGRNGATPVGDIDAAQAASIRAEVQRKEQAPSSRQQTFVDWRRLADQLGQPFEIERIPVSKLRAMRRDAMLAFGLAFMKTPHARAEIGIEAKDNSGPNPQVAGNVHYALDRIYTDFVDQFFLSLDFGSAAIAKRFEERTPAGTYIETAEDGTRTEQPLWSEGGIQPILWKPFVVMPPETVEPIWNSDGEFDGISYKPPQGAGAPAGSGGQSNGKDGFDIPLSHSLWVTNERQSVFGNMYGYPRLGYSYRYWWSYWFRWAIADRAFEKKGDPSIIVTHPDDEVYDPITQTNRPAADVAMEIGERMRSGGVITMPSDVWMGEISGAASASPKWSIDTLKEMLDFDPFDASFEYLDIMKLRSLWVPEQAFLEGKGGTSSRNVASEMGDSFMQQQELMSKSLAEHINRWVIPQFLAINFPEFIANGGTAKLVIKGFAKADQAAMAQMVQLIAQQERGARELASVVDLRQAAEEMGMPVRPFAEQERIRTEMEAEQAAAERAAAAPPSAPAGSGLSVLPTATGFAYVRDNSNSDERILVFSDEAASFERGLERFPFGEDALVRSQGRALWSVWNATYRDEYERFAAWLADAEFSSEFAEPGDSHWSRAQKIVSQWNRRANILRTLDKSKTALRSILRRASDLTRQRAGVEVKLSDEDRDAWIEARLAETTARAFTTNEEELTRFLANEFEEGESDFGEIAKKVRAHFDDHPRWKSDRLVRHEVRDAFNAGVLLTSIEANAPVLALDGLVGRTDPDCEARDGQLFDPRDALKEEEHINGTLTFRALPVGFQIVEMPDAEATSARYDAETKTVFFEGGVSDDVKRDYLKAVAERL